MNDRFITVEVDLQDSIAQMEQTIKAELRKRGLPLCWALTNVDVDRQKALVGAVICDRT